MYKPFTLDSTALMQAIVAEIAKQNPEAQIDVSLINKILFASNDIAEDAGRTRVYADKPMTVAEWFKSDDTGSSSKYMATVIADLGFPPLHGPTPADSDDLGRCIRMIECCGLEDKIQKMKEASPAWSQIIENWSQLKEWHKQGEHELIYEFLN